MGWEAGLTFQMNTNGQDRQSIQARLGARGPDGEPLLLITGQESLAELRQMIIEFSYACPKKQIHLECPFHILGTLSHTSLASFVNGFSREACVDLFQMERECRSLAATPCAPKSQEYIK